MISKTQLNTVLRESSVDPRKAGPFKIFTDQNDPQYLRKRVIELLYEAELMDWDNKLKQAITLLAMARCMKAVEKREKAKNRRAINPKTKNGNQQKETETSSRDSQP